MTKIVKVSRVKRRKVLTLFGIVIKVLAQKHKSTDKKAGAIIQLLTSNGEEQLFRRAGTTSEDKFQIFEDYVVCKSMTLYRNPEHSLSFESCDMQDGPYPGGARFPKGQILSISGFTWQEDEISVLWIGYKLGWITLRDVMKLAKISQPNSTLFVELFGLFTYEKQAAMAA
jgi:hypothetical protein